MVVFPTPGFDDNPGMAQAGEPVFVQALIPETPVKRFDASVLIGLAWLDQKELNPTGVSGMSA